MANRRSVLAALLVASLCQAAIATDGDWPQWRGPASDGHSAETNVLVKWDESSIAWKTSLPGNGQSSPAIAGDRIFLTAEIGKGRERVVFCVDRSSGKIVWQETVWTGEPEKTHAMNGWASATCATDGRHVVAFFGRGGMHGFTVEGKKLWSRDLGKFKGRGERGPRRSSSATGLSRTAKPKLKPRSPRSIWKLARRSGKRLAMSPNEVVGVRRC